MFRMLKLLVRLFVVPFYRRVVLTFLTLAGTALVLSLGANLDFKIDGELYGTSFDIGYSNSDSPWPGLTAFFVLITAATWLSVRKIAPKNSRSKEIEQLEDYYKKRGNIDSVRQRFREVFGVIVSPSELNFLMTNPETSTYARALKSARVHVDFCPDSGFYLKKPRFPFRIFRGICVVLYFIFAFLVLPVALPLGAALYSGDFNLAFQLILIMFGLAAIAGVSLSSYATMNNSLWLVGRE